MAEAMDDTTADIDAELVALRARVTALEAERAELIARTSAVVAAAEERTYWLDRWNLDLNALMRRPGAATFRRALRAGRGASKRLSRARARLGS